MSLMDKIKQLAAEISRRRKFVHGDKGKLENVHRQLENLQPDNALGKASRMIGLKGIDLAWFLFCIMKFGLKDTKTLLFDNSIIDKWTHDNQHTEIQNDDSKFKKAFKKLKKSHPDVAARLHLWMLYVLFTGMVVGGVKVGKNFEGIKQAIKELAEGKEKEEKEVEKTYDATSKTFKKDFVNENWAEIVVSLLEFETYRDVPRAHLYESRSTYGPGLTWVYIDGKQYECKNNYSDTVSNFTEKEIWDQVRQHCLYPGECLSVMQKQLEKYGFIQISQNQALGLFLAGYQLPARLKDGTAKVEKNGKTVEVSYTGIIHQLKNAGNDTQKIVDSFIAGDEVDQKWRNGTNRRRWWCAMYYIGKISASDLLSMDMDAFSEIDINTIYKNGHFVYDDSTVEYALKLKNKKVKTPQTVQHFIDTHSVIKGIEKKLSKTIKPKVTQEKQINVSMEYTVMGLQAYEAKDYNQAIKFYQSAIDTDPNNMEAYSSLALSYKKLGDQTHQISDYEKSLQVIRQCNAQMNANKSLLYDAKIKAAMYFNAGLAHEEIAQIHLASGNKNNAINSLEKAKKNFETALANATKVDNEYLIHVYESAINRVSNKSAELKKETTKSKATAFNDGVSKIKNKHNKTSNIIDSNNQYSA